MIQNILIEGFIYAIMVLGVFTTFRVLNFCDMTVDGSFPLGACVLASLLLSGVNPILALLLSFVAGMCAGLVTALIYTKLNIPDLLSGILTMTMLYSVNLRIMHNKANVSFLKIPTVMSNIKNAASVFAKSHGILESTFSAWMVVLFLLAVILVIKFFLDLFYHTDLGLTMGALGANRQMVVSQGVNPKSLTTIGICLGNGLAALSGAMAAMYSGFADVGSGTGIIVSGLASLMLGEFFIRSNKISLQTLRVIIGSIIYRALMYLGRSYGYKIGLTANDLKLITGILIILCLILSKADFISYIGRHMQRPYKKNNFIPGEKNA